MNTPQDPEDIHPEAIAPEERAFINAKAGFSLFGNPLHAYSASRRVAAQSMGMLYPYIGEGAGDQFEKTGAYAGMLKDILILLWLCTLPDASEMTKEEVRDPQAWNPSRAVANSARALDAAITWGEEQGLMEMNGEKYNEAAQVFIAMVTGVQASEFKLNVVAPEGESSAEDEDPESPNA